VDATDQDQFGDKEFVRVKIVSLVPVQRVEPQAERGQEQHRQDDRDRPRE
jgi:hypothetical protein